MESITYRTAYHYLLKKTYTVQIDIRPDQPVGNEYLRLDTEGDLTIEQDYAWDGPSGPVFHTAHLIRGSLVHDALYQLMCEGFLDHKIYRKPADQILRKICLEDGMWSIRAGYIYLAVRLFAEAAALPTHNMRFDHREQQSGTR